jgi:hypothetical protein
MDHLLHELPEDTVDTAREETRYDMESSPSRSGRSAREDANGAFNDRSPLLQRQESQSGHLSKPPRREAAFSSDTCRADSDVSETEMEDDPTKPLAGLNALEIAAVASAKKFLGQRLVQKVVQDIWDGNIIFWESLSVNAVKKARVYNKR